MNRVGDIIDSTPELEVKIDDVVRKGELIVERVQLTKEESELFQKLQKEGKSGLEISIILGK